MDYTYNKSTGLLSNIGDIPINYVASPNVGGTLNKPSLVVLHYTGSGGPDNKGDVGWFQNKSAKVSAHFVVGRDGSITQCVPLNRVAWHAGASIWRGVPNCNGYSTGIELDNWGIVSKRANGKYYSYTGQELKDADVVELPFLPGQRAQAWEVYTPELMKSVVALVVALRGIFSTLNEVVGHQDIAPGRKTDPGPALDILRIRAAFEGRAGDETPRNASVTASGLNVRGGPSTKAAVETVLTRGHLVEVQYEAEGWAFIRYVPAFDQTSTPRNGWVSSQYINYT